MQHNQSTPIPVNPTRLKAGYTDESGAKRRGDINAAFVGNHFFSAKSFPVIEHPFILDGRPHVTVSVLGETIASAYQIVPADARDLNNQTIKSHDGYEGKIILYNGETYRLEGPIKRLIASQDLAPDATEAGQEAGPESASVPSSAATTSSQTDEVEAAALGSQDPPLTAGGAIASSVEDRPLGCAQPTDAVGQDAAPTATDAEEESSAVAPPASPRPEDSPPRSYGFKEMPLKLVIQFSPRAGGLLGRDILIGAQGYRDDPVYFHVAHERELGELPQPLLIALQKLEQALPALSAAYAARVVAEAAAKRREEERKLRDRLKRQAKSSKTGAAAKTPGAATPAGSANALPVTTPEAGGDRDDAVEGTGIDDGGAGDRGAANRPATINPHESPPPPPPASRNGPQASLF